MSDETIPHKNLLAEGIPGASNHYRAYVGPPEDYDIISAMTFNLLTTIGLRQHHRLLDIGCGSLRNGRLLIPYLNAFNYTGIDPNSWLIEEGKKYELGENSIKNKRPEFIITDQPEILRVCFPFDFALAQSIFSHCGTQLISRWLKETFPVVRKGLLATFRPVKPGEKEFSLQGWFYDRPVPYRPETIESLAHQAGFLFKILDWRHVRQVWALFYKPEFDISWFEDKPLSWNTYVDNVVLPSKMDR